MTPRRNDPNEMPCEHLWTNPVDNSAEPVDNLRSGRAKFPPHAPPSKKNLSLRAHENFNPAETLAELGLLVESLLDAVEIINSELLALIEQLKDRGLIR